jgi:branched-chain amino acid aminotransferase
VIAYVDGRWMRSDEARVSVFDHGLLYGDGVFEGIRFYAGEPFLLAQHLRRLQASARTIALTLPHAADEFAALCREACQRTGLADGYLRLVVTRGVGALGVSPASCTSPTVILVAAPLVLYPPDRYRDGLVVVTASLRRATPDAVPPQAKTLNYLTSVLASVEARRQGADEALVLNSSGHVAECTADNVFFVTGGVLSTPLAAHGALAGITRQLVLDLARAERIPTHETLITLADAWSCDEMFLTGTGAELAAVRLLDGRSVGGDGRPVTDRLATAFRRYITDGSWRAAPHASVAPPPGVAARVTGPATRTTRRR